MSFGEKIRSAIEKLKGKIFVDDAAIKEMVREIQKALISADVEINLVYDISKKIEEMSKKEPPKGLTKKEYIIKNTYDLLVELLGGNYTLPENTKRILLIGLYGSGKTTTTAKLAKWFSKRGKKVLLVSADTARPAAYEQLKQLAEKINVAFYGDKEQKDSSKIAKQAYLESEKYDVTILDSAGRSALDDDLAEEIKKISENFKPVCKWLVMSADLGQIAKKQASAFHEIVGIDGVIITKTDGSAKGGGALAACHATNAKVYFIGTGEKIDDIQEFDAQRYLSRVLGYGDLKALIEKAEEIKDEINIEEIDVKEFNLETFYKQLKAARKIGPLGKVLEMVGLSQQIPKELVEVSEEKLNKFGYIIDSMTKAERKNPDILNKSRIQRIAKGSGTTEAEVRELIKQYKMMEKMFDKFKRFNEKSLRPEKLDDIMKKFGLMKRKKLKIR
ncbi:MAG: signal recognition particle receptor subunit alpha [Candidatus Diapherotrites archaeon]|nr:signal recognition particle receptor subunit alpha [Candidatus Diapherotrites archaeon]